MDAVNGAGEPGAAAGEPAWLKDLRTAAAVRFAEMAWPTPQEEEWRRTDVTAFDFSAYRLPETFEAATPEAPAVADALAGLIRFRGGRLSAVALRADLAARGVRFASLAGSFDGLEDRVVSLLRSGLQRADNRLIAWHYQHLSHGVLLHVPPFTEIEEPFLIECEELGDGVLTMPHVTVILETGARATVASRMESGPAERVLCNAALEIAVGDAARLAYFEQQSLSPTSTFFSHGTATVGREAELRHFAVSLGSRLAKTRLDCTMAGRGGTANLNGVYFAAGKQHMDLRTVQHHQAGSSYSRSHYKGAVRDSARTIYQGLIEVMRTAPGTDAYLTNRNLVLNDGARADSIPALRINQDDVRCSHGSTTGRLDSAQLFYLRARGLSPRDASRMLITAYFQELVDQVPEIMREPILAAIEARA